MSRLDSFIRRLEAQRATLAEAVMLAAPLSGSVLEIGLGNGRTYDHLREIATGREIFAFDRANNAHPACVPDAAHLVLGEFSNTLPAFAAAHPASSAIVHFDTGSGDKAASLAQAAWVGAAIAPAMKPGAMIASDQPLELAGLILCPIPGVAEGRYHLYRRA